MAAQIPLPFGNFDRFNFDQYIPGPNLQAVTSLQGLLAGTGPGFIYLWGSQGTGKSHLLQATCAGAAMEKLKVAYLPMMESAQWHPELLQGLEYLDCVCLDDLQYIAGNAEWERAVFTLYNGLAEYGNALVISSSYSPAGIPVRLADLKSRLAAGLTCHLQYPDENERLMAVRLRAHARGFELSDEVLDYLSRRVARDMHSLFNWLDRLDEATLVSKKKLTVPFVRSILEQNGYTRSD